MKTSLIIAVILLSATAQVNGKGLGNLRYTVDTFHYQNQAIPMQRYNKDALDRIGARTGTDAMLARALKGLQPLLDMMRKKIRENKEIDYLFDEAKLFLSDIREADNTFDVTNYRNELNFYVNINSARNGKKPVVEQKNEEEVTVSDEEPEKGRVKPGATKISSYKDLGIRESAFKLGFGSVAAYNLQVGSKLESAHGYLVPFIGAKAFWADEIPVFMAQELNCSGNIETDKNLFHTHFVVSPGITWGDMDTTSVFIDFTADDTFHIAKCMIKGNLHLLKKLFIHYWYRSGPIVNYRDIHKGDVLQKDYLSDRITFNWKGTKPYITITKNPEFSMPIPLQLERKE